MSTSALTRPLDFVVCKQSHMREKKPPSKLPNQPKKTSFSTSSCPSSIYASSTSLPHLGSLNQSPTNQKILSRTRTATGIARPIATTEKRHSNLSASATIIGDKFGGGNKRESSSNKSCLKSLPLVPTATAFHMTKRSSASQNGCDGSSAGGECVKLDEGSRPRQSSIPSNPVALDQPVSVQPSTPCKKGLQPLCSKLVTIHQAPMGIRVPSKHLLFVPRSQYEQVFEGFNVLDGIFKRNTHQIKGYDGSEPEQRELSVSPHCQDLQSWLGFERINALVGNRGRSGVWNAVFHRCNTVTMVWQLVATWQPGPSGDGAVRLAITTINYDYTRGRIHTPAGLCLTKKATEWLREDIFPQYFSAAAQITGREFPRKALCPTHPCSGCHSCSSADDVRADGRIRTKLVAQDGSISYIHFDNDVDETADAEDRSNDADDECNDPYDESIVAQSAAEAATSNSKNVLPNRPQQSNADNSKRSIQEDSSPSSSSESSPSSSSESSSSSNSDDDDQSSPPARKRQRKYDQLDQVRLKALHSFR